MENMTKGLKSILDEFRGKPKLFQAQVRPRLLKEFLKQKRKEVPKLTNQQFIEMFIVCYLENCKK